MTSLGLMKKVQKSQMRIENLEKALDVVEQEVTEMRCRYKPHNNISTLTVQRPNATRGYNRTMCCTYNHVFITA